MKKMHKILSLHKTCDACPSQWESMTDDGHMIYIRYRWGLLTAEVSRHPTNNIYDALGGELVLKESIGDHLSGSMSTEDMISYTKDVLDFSECDQLRDDYGIII